MGASTSTLCLWLILFSCIIDRIKGADCPGSPAYIEASNTSADLESIFTSWTAATPCDGSLIFNAPSTNYFLTRAFSISPSSNWTLTVGAGVTNVSLAKTAVDQRLFQLYGSSLIATGLTFDGGDLEFSWDNGGCIMADYGSSVTLSDCHVKRCRSSAGGALYLAESQTVLHNTVFDENHAQFNGGSISAGRGSTIHITGSEFVNNSCGLQDYGGAIYGSFGLSNVTVAASAFKENFAGAFRNDIMFYDASAASFACTDTCAIDNAAACQSNCPGKLVG
jgi:hypothetical protein